MTAIGGSKNPIYVNANGAAVASEDSEGQETASTSFTPVRLASGAITAASTTIGGDRYPLKMVNGALQKVSSEVALKSDLVVSNNTQTGTLIATITWAGGTVINIKQKDYSLPTAGTDTGSLGGVKVKAGNGLNYNTSTGVISMSAPTVTSETWTFEALDGSTTTKTIVSAVSH